MIKSAPIKLSDQAGFAENTVPKEIQILRAGEYYHAGKKILVSKQDLEKMVVNFREKVRGIDLMVDFSHESEGEAAAWIDDVYLTENNTELWARVIWTPSGEEAVLNKKYRYISADFDFNYKDNETLAEFGPTLFGAGLTNRPVVKKMQPVIQLSEKYNEEKNMDLEKKIEELMAMIASLVSKVEMMEKSMKPAEKVEATEEKLEDKKELKEELSDDSKKELLSETNKLIEENKALKKENEFNKLFSEGKVVEAQRKAFLDGDMVAFSEAAAKIHQTNTGTPNENKNDGDAEEKVIKLAEKLCKEDGIDFGKAVAKVLNENPKLSEEYNKKFNS